MKRHGLAAASVAACAAWSAPGIARAQTDAPAPPASAASASASQRAITTLPAVQVTGTQRGDTVTEGTGSYTTRATGAATRMELSLRETPQSVTVITRQQIEDQNLSTLSSVVAQTPGVVVNRTDERVTFSSRGFDPVNYLLDGVPTLAFRSVAAEAGLTSLVPYDRVEVVRGAAGLLNGTGSPSGSINLVRKRPTRQFQGQASVGIGSWNSYELQTDVGGSLNEAGTVRGRVAASYTDGKSFIERRKRREDVLYGIVEADLAPSTTLSAGLEYQRTAITGANFGQVPLFYSDNTRTAFARSFSSSAPWSEWNMTTSRVFTNLEHRLDGGWALNAAVAYAMNERERFSADIWLNPQIVNPTTGATTLKQSDNPARSENRSIDVYATGPFELLGRTHEATVGANINRYRYWVEVNTSLKAPGNLNDFVAGNVNDLASVPQPAFNNPAAKVGSDTKESAIYGSVRLKPLDPLSVIVGGRVSSYEDAGWSRYWFNGANGARVEATPTKENSVFTPYFGVTYDLSRQFSAYASYTDVFTPNTVKGTDGNILAPQRGKNQEVGLKGEHFDGRLNTSLAFFWIDQDNVPVLIPGAAPLPDGTSAYRADQGAKSRGYELTAGGELMQGWQVMGGYTYAHKQTSTGAELNGYLPTRLFRVTSTLRNVAGVKGLTLGGNVGYQSGIHWDELYGRGRVTQGGLTLVGLMAAYEFNARVSASLNIENVTDKTYYSGLGGNGYNIGTPRNAWLKLHYKL